MRTRVVAAGVLTASVLLFVPPLRVAGPLLGGLLVGVLLARTVPFEEVSYMDVRHSSVAGGVVGFVYFLTVSGIGTSLVIHTVPYDPFLDYSVRSLQSDLVRVTERVAGIDDLTTTVSALTFGLLVGGFAFGSMIAGEAIGKRLVLAASGEPVPENR